MTYRSAGIRHGRHGFVLDGELTIRGVTRPVSLRFEVSKFTTDPADGSTRAGFSAAGEINRMDFGVCTNVPIGGGLASDKVRIDIEAGTILRQQEKRQSRARAPACRPQAARRPHRRTRPPGGPVRGYLSAARNPAVPHADSCGGRPCESGSVIARYECI